MISKPNELYPELPTASPVVENEGAQNFRLKQIRDIREFLQKESETRGRLRRRYKSLYNAFYYINTSSGIVSVGSSTAAAISLATGIGAIATVPLGITAVITGVTSVSSSTICKVILRKVEKHERIKFIAMTKSSSVNELVARALEDNDITDMEFRVILREMESYRDLKSRIKTETKVKLSHEQEERIRQEGQKKGEEIGKEAALRSLLQNIPRQDP